MDRVRRFLCWVFGHREGPALVKTLPGSFVRNAHVTGGRERMARQEIRSVCERCGALALRVRTIQLWPPIVRLPTMAELREPCPRNESDGP